MSQNKQFLNILNLIYIKQYISTLRKAWNKAQLCESHTYGYDFTWEPN